MVEELTQAEQRLIEAAAAGEVADYSTSESAQDIPGRGLSWGTERTLRSDVVRRLCLGLAPGWLVDPKGVHIRGAKIVGDLDLNSATIAFPLTMVRCHVAGALDFTDATTKQLSLLGSWLSSGFAADGMTVKGDVFLAGGFSAKGEVRLQGADIGGNLECGNGTFENQDGSAINADGMTVRGSVFLREGFSAKGEVRLLGADISGVLACGNGTFENQEGSAINADRMTVKGGVFLSDGFSAKGQVRLLGANIGGDLECSNGAFENPNSSAISGDSMTVKGNMFLRGRFSAKGVVRLLGADIGGNLECDNGTFENPGGCALDTDGITVKGNVFLRDHFGAKGEVRLLGAEIGGNLMCYNGTFENPGGHALTLTAARIARILVWCDLTIAGKVSFAHAKIGQLADHRNSWPTRGAFDLNGFEYDEFALDALTSSAARVDWLKRQEPFRQQPYEQVVRVLLQMGHDRDAREIAIAKQVALRESGLLTQWGQRWNRFLELTVSYGYKPWKALSYAVVLWVLGAALFDLGFNFGLVTPTNARVFLDAEFIRTEGAWLPPEYPRFSAPVYSLDVFLPIVDLHQESRWLPNMRNGWGWGLWIYMWVHISAGWVLTSVFVAALTGLIKRD